MKSTRHAVYEAKYHSVWCPKYRKRVLVSEARERVKQLFYQIAEQFDFKMDSCEVAEDHIHILESFLPRYSIAKVAWIIKGISSNKVLEGYPKLKEKFLRCHLWEQGYFVRTVGEQVAEGVIRRYIEKHIFHMNNLHFRTCKALTLVGILCL